MGLPCELYSCKLVLLVHFSVEKLCCVTCHMITPNVCPSSSEYVTVPLPHMSLSTNIPVVTTKTHPAPFCVRHLMRASSQF